MGSLYSTNRIKINHTACRSASGRIKQKEKQKMKNYNIENKNVNYESNLTSERQAYLLEKVIKENPDKKITVKRIWGDARSAWKKYKNNPSYTQIGRSQGSSHCMDNFHSTWAVVE
jgi:hypothetical protein